MKTIPPPCPEPDTGQKYWRSLDQLAETPEFRQWVEREFPAGASELNDPLTRRHFVQIMSASFLFAGVGLTGCRRPVENILPFSKMPEDYVHGMPRFYATAMPTRGSAIPLVVRADDSRPTKIEGNAQHPDSNGGTDVFAQASILNLYDPDRAMQFKKAGNSKAREEALDELLQIGGRFAAATGEGLAFLVERSSSPSRARLQGMINEKFPKARWFAYEPVDFDIVRQANAIAFGQPVAISHHFNEARAILSLDCDFIGAEENCWRNIRGFAASRRIEKPADAMSRLYAIEGLFTLTGLNADHRLRVPPSAVPKIAARIALEVLQQLGTQASTSLGVVNNELQRLANGAPVEPKWATECAKDLLAQRNRSLVVAGYRQPEAVHLIAAVMNAALGAVGTTVVYQQAPAAGKDENILQLAQALNGDQVNTLVILGGNPVYNAPADLNWAQTQRRAKNIVRLGYYEDETFEISDWHLPQAHYLESWGDARTPDGSVVPIQPLIEPLFGGVTEIEVLARIAGFGKPNPHEIVRDTFTALTSGEDLENNWRKFLHDGFLAGSAAKPVNVQLNASALAQALQAYQATPAPSAQNLELVFYRDYSVDDGRFNNNGWLQELPDPITKMTWENVILLSKNTARELNVQVVDKENNNLKVPVIRIQLAGQEIEGPAWIQPGMADNVIGLALGYGRTRTGRIGRGSGYNAYKLRTATATHFPVGAKAMLAGKVQPISTTQHHWAMEGRPIVREANLDWFRQHPKFAQAMKMEEPPSIDPLYPNPLDKGKESATHWWGMSIDLNTCVGCSACMMACQSENNVPIVGKDQVGRGREMHWIRIDRYYSGTVENPEAVTQPMLCQHCESAPCESVCPVNATVHDEEGLNVMVYNRCVGTRYCSNNCPYKVRRFNYFDFNKRPLDHLYESPLYSLMDGEWGVTKWLKNVDKGSRAEDEWELMKLARNPQVTVRMRGVMEKCSFCLQRIEAAKIAQKVKAGPSGDVEVPEGTIKTACQQACPAEAIVFGNIKDPNSRVSKLKQQERDYKVLDFLSTKPRLTYLARIRNPNPAMPEYHEKPLSFVDWESRGNRLEGAEHGTDSGTREKGAH